MTGKRNDHKERWLQENNDCNKAMTAKNRPLQRAVLEGSLARKLRFHMFSHLQLADFEGSLHESFHCTTSTCRCWRNLARKLRFHIFNSPILKKARAKAFLCTTSTCRFWKGSLARKLRFHQLAARSWGKHVPHHRLEPCQPIVAQILVFWYYLIPNSISFSMTYSMTYSYYLIPITCVFGVNLGLLGPCVQKQVIFLAFRCCVIAFRCYVCSRATARNHVLDFALLLFEVKHRRTM